MTKAAALTRLLCAGSSSLSSMNADPKCTAALGWGWGWRTQALSVQRPCRIPLSMVPQARLESRWPRFHGSETNVPQEQPLKDGSLRRVRLLLKRTFPSRMPSDCSKEDN